MGVLLFRKKMFKRKKLSEIDIKREKFLECVVFGVLV